MVGSAKAGSSGSTSTIVRRVASGALGREQVADLLLDEVADHALGLGAEHVERIGLDVLVGGALQREQADLRAVAVRDDELVVAGDPRESARGDPDVRALVAGGHRLAPLEQGVAAESDDDAHRTGLPPSRQAPSVATMIALMVCIRFSAWSQTIDRSDSNTSS